MELLHASDLLDGDAPGTGTCDADRNCALAPLSTTL